MILYNNNNKNILNPFFNLLNQHFKSFDSNIISIRIEIRICLKGLL